MESLVDLIIHHYDLHDLSVIPKYAVADIVQRNQHNTAFHVQKGTNSASHFLAVPRKEPDNVSEKSLEQLLGDASTISTYKSLANMESYRDMFIAFYMRLSELLKVYAQRILHLHGPDVSQNIALIYSGKNALRSICHPFIDMLNTLGSDNVYVQHFNNETQHNGIDFEVFISKTVSDHHQRVHNDVLKLVVYALYSFRDDIVSQRLKNVSKTLMTFDHNTNIYAHLLHAPVTLSPNYRKDFIITPISVGRIIYNGMKELDTLIQPHDASVPFILQIYPENYVPFYISINNTMAYNNSDQRPYHFYYTRLRKGVVLNGADNQRYKAPCDIFNIRVPKLYDSQSTSSILQPHHIHKYSYKRHSYRGVNLRFFCDDLSRQLFSVTEFPWEFPNYQHVLFELMLVQVLSALVAKTHINELLLILDAIHMLYSTLPSDNRATITKDDNNDIGNHVVFYKTMQKRLQSPRKLSHYSKWVEYCKVVSTHCAFFIKFVQYVANHKKTMNHYAATMKAHVSRINVLG